MCSVCGSGNRSPMTRGAAASLISENASGRTTSIVDGLVVQEFWLVMLSRRRDVLGQFLASEATRRNSCFTGLTCDLDAFCDLPLVLARTRMFEVTTVQQSVAPSIQNSQCTPWTCFLVTVHRDGLSHTQVLSMRGYCQQLSFMCFSFFFSFVVV